MIDGRFPAAVIFLNVGVIVVHLGVVGERPQSRPAGQIEKEKESYKNYYWPDERKI
jgi:hypothetical protein